MRKKSILIITVLVLTITLLPAGAFADSALKKSNSRAISMTVYDDVIKSGNTLYCNTAAGIYKVKVRNGKVRSKKLLVEGPGIEDSYINMKLKGKYLYFIVRDVENREKLWRVKTSTGRVQVLTKWIYGEDMDPPGSLAYVIKGQKIYYRWNAPWDAKAPYKSNVVMKLNGKGKKKSGRMIYMADKKSNTRKYSVRTKLVRTKLDYNPRTTFTVTAKCYLKTPKKTYYLGKISE